MNNNHVVPLYQQVKEDIKGAIEKGKYLPKERIPSEPELSAEYSVSRITIRRSIDELCAEGYLVKMQGKGTFVCQPRIHRKITASNRIESFTQTCESNGVKAGGRLICTQIVSARPDESEFLQIGRDEPLLYVERIRTADDQPIFQENLFFPYEKYKSLMGLPNLGTTSIFDAIEELTGKRPVDTDRRTIEIARASVEQAELLEVSISDPLFFVNVYFLDENAEPVGIGRQYYVGSRYMFDL